MSIELHPSLAVDGEDAARHAEVALLHLARPVVEDLLRRQLHPEGVAVRLQLLPLHVVLPPLAQHVLHALHVRLEGRKADSNLTSLQFACDPEFTQPLKLQKRLTSRLPPTVQISFTGPEFNLCTLFAEICSCCCLTSLPTPALVLLDYLLEILISGPIPLLERLIKIEA